MPVTKRPAATPKMRSSYGPAGLLSGLGSYSLVVWGRSRGSGLRVETIRAWFTRQTVVLAVKRVAFEHRHLRQHGQDRRIRGPHRHPPRRGGQGTMVQEA